MLTDNRADAGGGSGYDQHHGGAVISVLFQALHSGPKFTPERQPIADQQIGYARARVLAGAHELGTADRGVTTLVTPLMPAVLGELERHADNPAEQCFWVFLYLMYGLACGAAGEQDEQAMHGIALAFHAWDELFADGFVLHWRR